MNFDNELSKKSSEVFQSFICIFSDISVDFQ